MLERVNPSPLDLAAYRPFVAKRLVADIEGFAKELDGVSILHINSAAQGGGVAEILRSLVPLTRSLGIKCDWQVMTAPRPFYDVTKKIHHGLQGAKVKITEKEWRVFEKANRRAAAGVDGHQWDFVLVHDPQPCALLAMGARRGGARWAWRCHLDCERPDPRVAKRLTTYLQEYEGFVFSRRRYGLDGVRPSTVIHPAIDPLSPKNAPMGLAEARQRIKRFHIDADRPLIVQVSRFDPWKDQPGVLEAYRAARKKVPGLQLALIGSSADDDPQSASVLAQVRRATRNETDVNVLADVVDDRTVRAFVMVADVVLQKSLREGFGLTVSEALWAGTPVIGGDVGGIPLQVRQGREGYLVDTPEEAARRVVELLRRPERRRRMGRSGRQRVAARFLLPRLLRDELRFWSRLRDKPPKFPSSDGL